MIARNCAHQPVCSFSSRNLDCCSGQGLQVSLRDHIYPLPLSMQPFYQLFSLFQVRGIIKFAISLVTNSLSAFLYVYLELILPLSTSENHFLWPVFRLFFPPLSLTSFCVSEPFVFFMFFFRFNVNHIFYKETLIFFLTFWDVSIPDGESLTIHF